MLPLKIAFLWHFHQPYYKMDGEFLLPWTRLHGVKDYFDLPEMFNEFPEIRQTINIVPSLRMQIEEYIAGTASDRIQRLTIQEPQALSYTEKSEILRLFFLCNVENMVLPYKRYRELYELAQNKEYAISNLQEQDWRDLQMWYNLTWFGHYHRQRQGVKRLFEKERNFSSEEIALMFDLQMEALAETKPLLQRLTRLGQLEISCSPMYHPILPLLCNSSSALEADPQCILPENLFIYPQDARTQINDAVKYIEKEFGYKPSGMWPSEGSLSDEALNLMIDAGLQWAASDEAVLTASLEANFNRFDKYFPHRFVGKNGEISLFFRDHTLSDAIGFVYQRWNPADAASDFVEHLKAIRNDIFHNLGEEVLVDAVVPVILDGENCWEFYPGNGIEFRRELFGRLSACEELITVKMSEAITDATTCRNQPLYHVRAGSWINADFKIWIGDIEERTAWSLLSEARSAIEEAKNSLSAEVLDEALKECYIAEGSDWFWWYGNQHNAENKGDFDVMFRWHLRQIYRLIGADPPQELLSPIGANKQIVILTEPVNKIYPTIQGDKSNSAEWEGAGFINAEAAMDAMHPIGEILRGIRFGSNGANIYFRIELKNPLHDGDSIELVATKPFGISLKISSDGYIIKSDGNCPNKIELSRNSGIEVSFSLESQEAEEFDFLIKTYSGNSVIFYPKQGTIKSKLY